MGINFFLTETFVLLKMPHTWNTFKKSNVILFQNFGVSQSYS